MRGEYMLSYLLLPLRVGSPPLARGIRKVDCYRAMEIGITPACAGNTAFVIFVSLLCRDHPRLRGEYFSGSRLKPLNWGSPPLARGIHFCRRGSHLNCGITPACAGNTVHWRLLGYWRWDHPRLRGEYLQHVNVSSDYRGSPPLARGIPDLADSFTEPLGITPACAGNTQSGLLSGNGNRDHPRLRGEYCLCHFRVPPVSGSPPLARGILFWFPFEALELGITPACAGNTTRQKVFAVAL